jgi:hypothetical protein
MPKSSTAGLNVNGREVIAQNLVDFEQLNAKCKLENVK